MGVDNLVEDLINKYKQLIYTQIEHGNDETVKILLIELESCNYMLNFLEDYRNLLKPLHFNSKNEKAKFILNTIQAAVNNLPYKEDHEFLFKKACKKTLTWLFWTLKQN